MKDTFHAVASGTRAELSKVRGSRFIGDAFPVAVEDEAFSRLVEVQQREPAATHHCWAWRIGPAGERFRSSDDGEPSGTAGAPILRQIEGRGLTNTLVVVTRYYGGTRLGTGGLLRAYGDAAAAVLDAATLVEHVDRLALRLAFAYDDTAATMQTLHRFDTELTEQQYTDETQLVVRVRRSQSEELLAAFTEALGGRGRATVEAE